MHTCITKLLTCTHANTYITKTKCGHWIIKNTRRKLQNMKHISYIHCYVKKREETKRYRTSPDETRRDKKGEDGTGWEQKEPEETSKKKKKKQKKNLLTYLLADLLTHSLTHSPTQYGRIPTASNVLTYSVCTYLLADLLTHLLSMHVFQQR